MKFLPRFVTDFPSYAMAIVGVLIAAGIRYQLGPILGATIPVVVFTVPVVLSALYGGFWPGIFCTLISAVVSDFLFMEPLHSLGSSIQTNIVLLIFIVIGATISYFGERMKVLQFKLWQQTKRLEESNQQLTEANLRKDEFLAMLAHELRNPLAGISTAAELLGLIRTDPPRIAHTGEMISRQVRHMTKLVDDLLDVSRVTRGLVMIDKHPLEIKQVVQESIEHLRSAISQKQQHLSVNLPEETVQVCGDRIRLTQVIGNLLANANRYSPRGSQISVQVNLHKDTVEIAVEDSGQGIEEALLPHIFDLFVQGQRSLDRSQGGLGIGLALVKKIVELHQGTVVATSQGPGEGSRFAITLARHYPPVQHEPQNTVPVSSAPAPKPMRILIVDDNRDAANSMALLLQAYGHLVFVEYGAKAALDNANIREFDVVILDIGLPEMDGRTLCRQMKKIPRLTNAIYIAVSGYSQPSDLEQSRNAGFQRHFSKPANINDILETLATKVAH